MATVRVTRRSRTTDRGPPVMHDEEQTDIPGDGPPLKSAPATILTVEQIGPKRELTPQGFMLCRDVPLARTGWMMYAPGEVPIKAGFGVPIVYVHRGPEDLFSERTLRSIVGTAVVHEHPPVDVTAENWATLAKGMVLTARRGEGDDSDLILGDLLITDKWLIEQINAGKREVSLGYEASYQQTGDGQGRQFNILANHIALVEKGRCGPRCAIGDHDSLEEETTMPEQANTSGGKKPRVPMKELRQRVTDLAAAIEEHDEAGDDTHIHVHIGGAAVAAPAADGDGEASRTLDAEVIEERFAKVEDGLANLTKLVTERLPAQVPPAAKNGPDDGEGEEEEGEEASVAVTGDSAALARSYAELVQQAEILVPGYRVPTFDAKAARKATVDSMCKLRRSVLTSVYATADGKKLVDSITGHDDLSIDKMGCSEAAIVFRAAASLKGAQNNRATTGDRMAVPAANAAVHAAAKPAVSIADINAANAKFWAEHSIRV